MLRRILIASAAAALLLVTFVPTTLMLAVAEVAAIGAVVEATAAALSQFEGLGGGAVAVRGGRYGYRGAGYRGYGYAVSVRPRSAPLRSEPLRPGPIAAAATTPTATTFAPAGTVRTERRDAVGLWCSKPMTKSFASSEPFLFRIGRHTLSHKAHKGRGDAQQA